MGRWEWEGDVQCHGTGRRGLRCTTPEIAGMDYCLQHMPDEMLDEAEQLCNKRRCRHHFGAADACHWYAVEGTDPPACKNHGANEGSYQSKLAAANVVQLRVATAETEKLVTHWDQIIAAPPVTDAISELRKVAGQIVAWKDFCLQILAGLPADRWRYSAGKAGEQLRAELLLLERALDRAERCLVSLAKLDLDGRAMALDEKIVNLCERALLAGLQASDASVEGRDNALRAMRRELKAVS